MINFQSI